MEGESVKLIYQLKDSIRRIQFIRQATDNTLVHPFEFFCAVVCLIKEDKVSSASKILNRLDEKKLSIEELKDLIELIGVLWAERELTNSNMSKLQSTALKSFIDRLGGLAIFKRPDDERKSISPREMAAFKLREYRGMAASVKKFLVISRRHWWSEPGVSRLHELPQKLYQTLKAGGTEVQVIYTEDIFDPSPIIWPLDSIVVMDVQALDAITSIRLIGDLRKRGCKLIGLYADMHYAAMTEKEIEIVHNLDVIWAPSASPVQLINFHGDSKFTDFPLAVGLDENMRGMITTSKIYSPGQKAKFVGGIERNNIPRVVYFVDSKIDDFYSFDLSTHLSDGRTAAEGYLDYLKRLSSNWTSINFSLRYSGAPAITGRVVESIAIGNLLVQEETPQLERWFTKGQHYLSFTGVDGLRSVLDSVYTDPRSFKDVAMEAKERYQACFSERACVEHLIGMIAS
jgi:hypothetical protein